MDESRVFVKFKRKYKEMLGVIIPKTEKKTLVGETVEIELINNQRVTASKGEYRVCYNQREIMLGLFDHIKKN